MALVEYVLGRRRLALTVATLLALAGAAAWLTMVRQEDPRLPDYWGQVVVVFPGADAATVERQVVEPMEDALAEVAAVHTVRSSAFADTAVLAVELNETTSDITAGWDEVRRALADARRDFPAGAGAPSLRDDLGDQESVVLAVTGSADPLVLRRAARRLRRELLAIPQVARVTVVGDPGEQVTVELDDAAARALGTSAPALAAELAGRTHLVPGGSLAVAGRSLRLRPLSELRTAAEVAATPVLVAGGAAVPLAEVARVHEGPAEPTTQRMHADGELAVGLGVVPRKGIDVVRFGRDVRARVATVAPELAPLEVRDVAFQPDRVAARLSDLGSALLMGVLVVAGVLVLAMGLRLGLLVASVVPLVAAASLAVYAMGGGVLHQISIAALVLALGMLVDNAIVVAENVQWRLDSGARPAAAAAGAVRELAVPLGGATATTLAAFLPMLLSSGATADFTRAIPVVVMLTLAISYAFALLVTPALAERVLVPHGGGGGDSRVEGLGRRLAGFALRRRGMVLTLAVAAVTTSVVASAWVPRQFFPASDRNQLTVDVTLPEGAHIDATEEATRTLERALLARPEVTHVASFVGRSAPHFYYNLPQVPFSPHLAQLVVETRSRGDVAGVVAWTRVYAARALPGAEVVARGLEQGPPVDAPVEVRLSGPDLDALSRAATAVTTALRAVPGAVDIRTNQGPGAPTLEMAVDDAASARVGLSRADVAEAVLARSRGLVAGSLSRGDEQVPVVVRSGRGEATVPAELEAMDVPTATGGRVPLGELVHLTPVWRPAVIRHRARARTVTVSAQLADGVAASQALAALQPRLAGLDLPAGVRVGLGGEAEGSGEANASLLRTLPLGAIALLGVLLLEFNSFRRVAIILVTVPLAAAGVVPGLLVGGQPFGFMSMLGVIALVGVVVNNAIVLLEVVEERRRAGATLDEALQEAVARRVRPILLTTATTIAGLLPLALSQSSLWPPLAWAMISGLAASTLLTLAVVPALYRVVFGHQEARTPRVVARAAAVLLLLAVVPRSAGAAEALTMRDAMARAVERPAAAAAAQRTAAARAAAVATRRAAVLPTVGASATLSERDRDLAMVTPFGDFNVGARRQRSAGLEVTQPLIDPAGLLYGAPAAGREAAASASAERRTRQQLAAAAGEAYLDVLVLDARAGATRAYVASLERRLAETEARASAGRALAADALKVRLALEQAQQDLQALREARGVAVTALAHAVGADGGFDVAAPPRLPGVPLPAPADAEAKALAARADLAALAESVAAATGRARAVRAEALPRVALSGRWSYANGAGYAGESWGEAAVTVRWAPFAAGTRGPRAAAEEARAAELEARLAESRRGVALEVDRALAAAATADGALEVATRGVEQATEALRVERERYAAGRTTTYELLAAEAELRERRASRDVARLEAVRGRLELWLAEGEGDRPDWVS